MIMVVQKRGIIPDISRELGKSTSATNQTSPIFIINPNKPKVIILIGKEMAFRIGLIRKLTNPRIPPINSKSQSSNKEAHY